MPKNAPDAHFILFYEGGADYAERRAPYRSEHLALARAAKARGEMVLAGAYADPCDGAAIVFKGGSPDVAVNFAKADPYVVHGVVQRWHVRKWTTVVGDAALNEVKI
jgi:uncharacterized protein YciI